MVNLTQILRSVKNLNFIISDLMPYIVLYQEKS
jgi:hypothetical protein